MPTTLAIVAALEREVRTFIKLATRVHHTHAGRTFDFFEMNDIVLLCAGIGHDPARRAAEAIIAIYQPRELISVGFAGALTPTLRVGDIFTPATIIDVRDGSRTQLESGQGTLLTFMSVAGAKQKATLAQAYSAQAIDMEAAAVATAARAHGIPFTATKVISDGLDFDMPETSRFINSNGQFQTASFAAFAALRPWLWPRVAILARNSSKAATALARHLKNSHPNRQDVTEAKTT
jgi:adenosylhomocysteine nucleosidase